MLGGRCNIGGWVLALRRYGTAGGVKGEATDRARQVAVCGSPRGVRVRASPRATAAEHRLWSGGASRGALRRALKSQSLSVSLRRWRHKLGRLPGIQAYSI